jgi:hypothetical protein
MTNVMAAKCLGAQERSATGMQTKRSYEGSANRIDWTVVQ